MKDFRPRLGMGWFLCLDIVNGEPFKFSSPLGDGLAPYLLLSH